MGKVRHNRSIISGEIRHDRGIVSGEIRHDGSVGIIGRRRRGRVVDRSVCLMTLEMVDRRWWRRPENHLDLDVYNLFGVVVILSKRTRVVLQKLGRVDLVDRGTPH